ncbi:MAG: N-acetyl-gamma-glutamyl-phosphate reductase [Myxococcota bacterium]
MTPSVFIDGHAGTAGLRIREWLRDRDDLTLVTLEGQARKDPDARRRALNTSDLVVLCLPDEAAREAVGWIESPGVRVLDASTAHRVAPDWVYGLPELVPGHRSRIGAATRVSNPGCYPTGVILLVRPLIDAGLLSPDLPLTVEALSGYSGGGRTLIERWEDPKRGLLNLPYAAPYALERVHKHVPEMVESLGLRREPCFVPAVGPFRCGMRIQIPLHAASLPSGTTAKQLHEVIEERYAAEPFVRVQPFAEPLETDERTFDPRSCNDTNRIELWVVGNPLGHVRLVACLDNLGKGAAGVAIQCVNLMLGVPEERGLRA